MLKRVSRTMATIAALSALVMVSHANAGSPKLQVKDSSGNVKFVVNDDGATGVGVSAATYPFLMTSDIAGSVPAGVGAFMFQGSANKERFEVQSFGNVYAQGPVFQGKGGGWDSVSKVPTKTLFDHNLFMLGGSGHNGSNIVIGNTALIKIKAESDWSPSSYGTVIVFETTPTGSTTRAEAMRVAGNGNIGVGSTSPAQKLEVNGGIRMTGSAMPACNANARGTMWFSNGGAGKDTLSVCAQDAGGVLDWRTIY